MNIKTENEDLGRLSPEAFKAEEKWPIHIVLDNVRSAQNVGSLFRTMDAFKCAKLYLCGICAQPPHREINKTALGATETVEWAYYENTEMAISEIKNKNIKVLAIEQASDSKSLSEFELKIDEQIAFVFGNEVHGVSQEIIDLSDGCLEIPQYGTKHSINISVCAGITIWEATRAFRKEIKIKL